MRAYLNAFTATYAVGCTILSSLILFVTNASLLQSFRMSETAKGAEESFQYFSSNAALLERIRSYENIQVFVLLFVFGIILFSLLQFMIDEFVSFKQDSDVLIKYTRPSKYFVANFIKSIMGIFLLRIAGLLTVIGLLFFSNFFIELSNAIVLIPFNVLPTALLAASVIALSILLFCLFECLKLTFKLFTLRW